MHSSHQNDYFGACEKNIKRYWDEITNENGIWRKGDHEQGIVNPIKVEWPLQVGLDYGEE